MEKRLQPQLKIKNELDAVLKNVEVSFKSHDDRDVQTLLVYMPLDGNPDPLNKFFSVVKEGILANFVLKCSDIERQLRIHKEGAAERLFNKAVRQLSKHTAQGELGELIMFTLLDVYLEAPKLLTKISTKTANTMPVFGADGVHGQFYDGQFKLYLGESKLHKSFNSAASKAAKSIKSANEKYQKEFDLIESHRDFYDLDEDLENILLEILDPLSNESIDEVLHSSCFIGFANPELFDHLGDEFENKYVELANNHVRHFFKKLEDEGVDINKSVLMILPFNDIENLVEEFIRYMDIQQ
tara:strand:+ start:80 stop:973 length:894 start_codon:yes stop_codon:yes gene_type:complete